MSNIHKFLVISLVTAFSSFAFGWGDEGHEATARVAELLLQKDSPKTIQNIQDIMGVEPMANAATWPDHVRNDKFEDFAPYHFLTIFEDPHQHNERDARVALTKFTKLLNSRATREAKMIALRYIIHIAGDVHQPLHIGNEFDRGGNWCRVNWTPAERETLTQLHKVWDTNLVNYAWGRVVDEMKKRGEKEPIYATYKTLAPTLMKKYPEIAAAKQDVNVETWIKESNDYLKDGTVYPDTLPANQRPYCKEDWSTIKDEEIPKLEKDYVERATDLVEKRIVLGGARLAALLEKTFENKKPKGVIEKVILMEVLNLKND